MLIDYSWPLVDDWPVLEAVANCSVLPVAGNTDCSHCLEHLEGTVVAIAGNTGLKVEGVPMDPSTVLVTDLKVVAHTQEREYGNQHAAPQMGVQMMLRGSLNWGHQQLWLQCH